MIEKLSLITTRQWAVFFAASSFAILSAVYISQLFGFHPCKLCIYQRVPYAVVLFLSSLLFFFHDKQNIALALLFLIGAALLFNSGLALFHMGVEYKWWEYNSDCAGGDMYKPGASVEEMMAALKKAPTVRCDDRVPFLFGMTMAFYNILTAFGLSVLAFVGLVYRSNSPSQYK